MLNQQNNLFGIVANVHFFWMFRISGRSIHLVDADAPALLCDACVVDWFQYPVISWASSAFFAATILDDLLLQSTEFITSLAHGHCPSTFFVGNVSTFLSSVCLQFLLPISGIPHLLIALTILFLISLSSYLTSLQNVWVLVITKLVMKIDIRRYHSQKQFLAPVISS